MLASESFDKNNIGRRVEHVELVFVIKGIMKGGMGKGVRRGQKRDKKIPV